MGEEQLDDVLEKLGKWGRYQIMYYVYLSFIAMYSVCSMGYIFSARDVKYRCLIPGCDQNATNYNPMWLKDFVPYKDNIPSRCLRYVSQNDTCAPEDINKNKTVICQSFVSERRETTIVHDFNITCDSNLWKLTIVGTINVIGELICLSYSGFISDRFGRARIMTIGALISCTIGTIKSFVPNYPLFLLMEFLDTALCSATYGAMFILAMELVPHDQRNIGNTVLSCVFTVGQMILGLVAWASPSWRIMIRTMYIPGLITVVFFWTVPESIRWLIHHKRRDEAKAVLLRIARTNKKILHQETIHNFFEINDDETRTGEASAKGKETFRKAMTNKVLFIRTICCSYIWMCCVFVYYGLTIHSVGISDNIYVSFIFTVAIEIPGYLIYFFVNEKVGRRKMMFSTLLLGGALCFFDEYIPEDYYWCKLIGFLAGKCCLTTAYTVLYVYTTELFPTCSRHSMFSICSMFGRFGSTVAPQIPLLARISKSLPLLMFGILAGSSGCLSLLLPETLNTKLPDTIDEAVSIGKKKEKHEVELEIPLRNMKG